MKNAELAFPQEHADGRQGIDVNSDREGMKMFYRVLLVIGLVAIAMVTGAVLSMNRDRDLPLDATCSLSTSDCARALPNGIQVRMGIAPARPTALQPFNVDVRLSGGEAVRVEFAIRGAGDGLDQAKLTQVGPGHWQGVGRLSLCGDSAMTAIAVVSVDGLEWRVPFGFEMKPAR